MSNTSHLPSNKVELKTQVTAFLLMLKLSQKQYCWSTQVTLDSTQKFAQVIHYLMSVLSRILSKTWCWTEETLEDSSIQNGTLNVIAKWLKLSFIVKNELKLDLCFTQKRKLGQASSFSMIMEPTLNWETTFKRTLTKVWSKTK